jgi:hypothetical protein
LPNNKMMILLLVNLNMIMAQLQTSAPQGGAQQFGAITAQSTVFAQAPVQTYGLPQIYPVAQPVQTYGFPQIYPVAQSQAPVQTYGIPQIYPPFAQSNLGPSVVLAPVSAPVVKTTASTPTVAKKKKRRQKIRKKKQKRQKKKEKHNGKRNKALLMRELLTEHVTLMSLEQETFVMGS